MVTQLAAVGEARREPPSAHGGDRDQATSLVQRNARRAGGAGGALERRHATGEAWLTRRS